MIFSFNEFQGQLSWNYIFRENFQDRFKLLVRSRAVGTPLNLSHMEFSTDSLTVTFILNLSLSDLNANLNLQTQWYMHQGLKTFRHMTKMGALHLYSSGYSLRLKDAPQEHPCSARGLSITRNAARMSSSW